MVSCLLPVLLRFFVFVFEFLVIIFPVMVQCGRLSQLLSAFESTINILYLIFFTLTDFMWKTSNTLTFVLLLEESVTAQLCHRFITSKKLQLYIHIVIYCQKSRHTTARKDRNSITRKNT